MVNRINQPTNGYGTDVNVDEFMSKCCGVPQPIISAINAPELGEAMMLGFDVEESVFEGTGKIEMSVNGPKMILPKKTIKEKNIHKIIPGELQVEKNKVIVTEFGNDREQYEAMATVNGSNTVVFKSVSGLQEGDKVLIVKSKTTSNSIEALVKITDVDTVTKEITFDTSVKIDAGDYIRFINSSQGGCMDNTKRISSFNTNAKSFEYYTQFISREVPIELEELQKCFMKGSQQWEAFTHKYWGQPTLEIYRQFARQIRYGSGIGGPTSEIKGYNTVIEERDSNNIESIVSFSSLTSAEEFQEKLEKILYRVQQSPVNSKFILIANQKFFLSYRNMLRKLYDKEKANACCKFEETIFNGIKKWNVVDAPMVDHYISDALTYEKPSTGVAYILPIDLMACYMPNYVSASMTTGSNPKLDFVKSTPNMFGTIMSREKHDKAFADCKVYELYTRLGFLYAGVSFRDTYFRLDDFNF